jgi:hypothetical protein
VLSVIGQTVKGPVRLEHVDLFLKGRLQQVGHTSLTYFSTPHRDGYAAITRLEQIDETGSPLKGSARFTKDAAESASLLYNFIKRLVSLPEGRFRLLVFFVSADPVAMNYTSMQLSLKDADRWVGEGCDSLPAQLASIQITNRHRVFLRVYEFASKGGASHLVGKSDSIPLSQHLSALGLRFELNK